MGICKSWSLKFNWVNALSNPILSRVLIVYVEWTHICYRANRIVLTILLFWEYNILISYSRVLGCIAMGGKGYKLAMIEIA